MLKQVRHGGSLDEREWIRRKGKIVYNQGLDFCDQVRGMLRSSDSYQNGFLRVFHYYNIGKINKIDFQEMVADAIGKYPNLVDIFNKWLKHCEDLGGSLAYTEFDKSVCDKRSLIETKEMKEESKQQNKERRMPKAEDKDHHEKPIKDLDLFNCEVATPSYRLIPKDYLMAKASKRPELVNQVLNDRWVCVPPENGNYSSTRRIKNQYEETLNAVEEDHYEFDMLLNSFTSAVQNVEKLLNGINEKEINLENYFKIEVHLSILNLRCIERLYAENGLLVLETLSKDPMATLPIILSSLKEKLQEISGKAPYCNKIWAQVNAENYYKSL